MAASETIPTIERAKSSKRTSRRGPRVLIVSEEKALRKLVRSTLTFAGCLCVEADTVGAVRRLRAAKSFEVAVLDLADVSRRGPALREWIAEVRPLPIIGIYDELSEPERLSLHDVGPEDLLAKPFSKKDLSSRLHAVLRSIDVTRFGAWNQVGNELTCGSLKMEIVERRVTRRGCVLNLTPLEFSLLRVMMIHQGQVLTQRYLLEAVWGPRTKEDLNYVRIFVASLRRKIEEHPRTPKYLHTKWKAGYVLVAPEVAGSQSTI